MGPNFNAVLQLLSPVRSIVGNGCISFALPAAGRIHSKATEDGFRQLVWARYLSRQSICQIAGAPVANRALADP